MRFYRCDRCKKEFNGNEYLVTEDKLGLVEPDKTSMGISFPYDICDDCLKDFENWFRQPMVDKAFEEARAKAHEHKDGEVTVLGLEDGRVICPVCGEVFEMFRQFPVALSNGSVYEKNLVIGSCPKCSAKLNTQHINYINLEKRGEVDDTTRTEN